MSVFSCFHLINGADQNTDMEFTRKPTFTLMMAKTQLQSDYKKEAQNAFCSG